MERTTGKTVWMELWREEKLAHSKLQKESFCPCSCAYGACRTRACSANFIFVLKNGQTEDGVPSDKGRELCYLLCVVFTFLLATTQWLVKRNIVFWSIWYEYLMDDDSEHKGNASDDGWVLNSEYVWEKESEIVSEWWQHWSVNCHSLSSFVICFPVPPWLCSS